MIDLYGTILGDPGHYRQLRYGESLLALYNCPLENKNQDIWSRYSYIAYVTEGRKIWHTADGSYDLRAGSCMLVRKGASVVEQFFDAQFCVILFFIPDSFIGDVLKTRAFPIHHSDKRFNPVIPVDRNAALDAFYQSMLLYFEQGREPDPSLLELKFRELILMLAENRKNAELSAYFYSLLKEPASISLQQTMEDNFRYNLRLEDFARLSARSLSAFKRDFQRLYQISPGKWLLEKRLQYARHLLSSVDKTVSEAAFESGFENASHFSRAFRSRFGSPPASVRRQTRN